MAEIAFIGAGKMAEAIVGGIIRSNIFLPQQVTISDVDSGRLSLMESKYGVSSAKDNVSAASEASCVVFAVKPRDIPEALADVRRAGCPEDTVFVSIAAGVKIASVKSVLGQDRKVFRVMPNLPVVEGEGASAVCGEGDKEDIETVEKIFGSVGAVNFVEEDLIDAFTALSGSGPGFVAAFAESLISAAEKLGIHSKTARLFAVQTVFGAAKMMKNGVSPQDLRKMVSSPGGTTVAGIAALERSGFAKAVESALLAAQKRSKELSSIGKEGEKA